MGDHVIEVTTCRVCGGSDWLDVVSLGSSPLANGYLEPADSYDSEPRYPLDVILCRDCRLVSLRHLVDPDILFRDYIYISSDSDLMHRNMRSVTDLCLRNFEVPADSLVVELGSNIGSQLTYFRDSGMRILGVDPAQNLAEIANSNGIDTVPEFFNPEVAAQVRKEHGRSHIILGRHVFAHIDDLGEVLAGVRELLDPAGAFVIEVPYLLNLIEGNQFDTIYHEHLSYFSVGTLSRLFERHGFQVIDVRRLAVHGGSILVSAGLIDGAWKPRPTVSEILQIEEQSGLNHDTAYRGFAKRVHQTRLSLGELVRSISADGKVIAGYGAPAKGNTLLNACGITTDDVAFCSDTTTTKQGKVLPGTHIPVRSPAHARDRLPDYYLLLAWNYAKEVVRNELSYLDTGGRFIIPIPEPSVVSASSLVEGYFTAQETGYW